MRIHEETPDLLTAIVEFKQHSETLKARDYATWFQLVCAANSAALLSEIHDAVTFIRERVEEAPTRDA